MKRTVSLLLILLMLFSSAAFAENFNAEGMPIVNNPITIRVMGPHGNTLDWSKTFAFQELTRRMNIQFDITTFDTDAWDTQFTLMLAENDLPDLFLQCNMNKSDINKYGDEGYFLDLSEYLDIMPNFVAFCEAHPDFAAYSATADGKIYSINRCRDTIQSRQLSHNWIKKSWLENVGMEPPTTIDELYDVLVAFKEQDANGNGDPNDEIPASWTFHGQSGQRVEFMLRAAFGIYSVSHNTMFDTDQDGKVFLYETTQNYRDYLTWLRKLYAEKLLDQEAFIQTTDEFRAKAKADTLGFFGDWSMLATAVGAENDFVERDYEYLISLANYETGKQTVVLYPNYTEGARVMVNAETEYPREICRLLDYLYSEEGCILVNFGAEGVTYDLLHDPFGNATHSVTPYWEAMKDQYPTLTEWQQQYLYPNNTLSLIVYDEISAIMDKATDEQLEQYIAYNEDPGFIRVAMWEKAVREMDELVPSFPFLVYTAEEASERSTLVTDINSYITNMKAQFITGEKDIETEWDSFQATLNGMGLDRLLTITQGAYDRYIAARK